MQKPCFKYSDITFRSTCEEDLDYVLDMEKSPENRPFVGQWTEAYHQYAMLNNDFLHMMIEYENEKAGYIILSGINSIENSIELAKIVIARKNLGIGRKALKAIKKIAFEELHAHRLWLSVRIKNEKAKSLYKSEGFIEEGILRDFIVYENSYESILIMSILEDEYST